MTGYLALAALLFLAWTCVGIVSAALFSMWALIVKRRGRR